MMGKSIAILADHDISGKRLQINYWINEIHTLDIGIELDKGAESNIRIYLPFRLEKPDIICISDKLKEKTLCSAVFNESCIIDDATTYLHYYNINFNGQRPAISVYQFPPELIEITPRNQSDACTISLKIRESETNHRYLRIRIKKSASLKDAFCSESRPYGSWLQSIISKNREIDFRVNSKRSLPQDLLIGSRNKLLSFETTHIFYLLRSDEDILTQNQGAYKTRFLEEQIWSDYTPFEIKNTKICAHYWRLEKANEVTLFVRSNFQSKNIGVIIKYTLITIAFGVTINFISNLLWESKYNYFGKEVTSQDTTKNKDNIPRKLGNK